MKTKNSSPARNVVLAALFLALAFVLPMVTGHLPQVGNMLCPMHFPILLCGFVLGGPWGLAVGFAAPLLRSVLFGMPPMFPIAISMAFELAAYGAVSGWLYRRVKHTLPMTYATLAAAMVAGRLVWGAVRFVLIKCCSTIFLLAGRLELPVLGLPVRCALHRCAGHHRTAGAHPPHHHRSAESQGAGVTGSRCLYRKSRNWCSIQTTSFRYAIQRCCCCIKKLNCCHQASQSSLRSPVPLIGGASGKKRKFFSLSKPLLRRRGGIAKP